MKGMKSTKGMRMHKWHKWHLNGIYEYTALRSKPSNMIEKGN